MREFECEACDSNDVAIKLYKKGEEWRGNTKSEFTKTNYEGYYVTTVITDYFNCKCKRCGNQFREAKDIIID